MQRVMQAYFNTKATTTSPGDVVVMLYDGAISFLERAKQKIIEKDYAQKGILISKAMDVIGELDSSLNIDKGGNLAENLHSLYFFCNTQLLQANLKMDTAKLDQVITILTDLRDAFASIVNTPEAMQAAQGNAMSQRAQAPQTRMPVPQSTAPSNIGFAKASSLYAKNTAGFGMAQPAPAMATTRPITPEDTSTQIVEASPHTESISTAPVPQKEENTHASPIDSPAKPSPQAPAAENTVPQSSQNASRFQGAALYKRFAQG